MKTTHLFISFIISLITAIPISRGQLQDLDLPLDFEVVDKQCICVPYWQCKEDFSGLIADGVDISDIRVLRNYDLSHSSSACTGDFDVCCEVECGKSQRSQSLLSNRFLNRTRPVLKPRILGDGNEAEFAEFPWMLGILRDSVYMCGASLIHPKVAITAAHCVTSQGTFIVRAGEWDWTNINEPTMHQDRIAQTIIIHPDFNSKSLKNDIALLILESPFKLTDNVGIICLPKDKAIVDSKHCIASGWGKNSFEKGSYQKVLKKVELPIVPSAQCVAALRRERLGPFFNLHESFICAGGMKNKDTCKGDGGSPLICPVFADDNRYEQLGIVSWGLTCGIQSTPGVYVNVFLFNDWVDENMRAYNFDVTIYRRS